MLNPTIMLNRVRYETPVRRGLNKRGLILSRWGGMGSHRYAVGFAGDQTHTWKGLKFLPKFTSTSANAAYGFWSHDTYGGEPSLSSDWELNTRWIQYSVFSPIFRFHDKGEAVGSCADTDTCAKVEIWVCYYFVKLKCCTGCDSNKECLWNQPLK